MNKIIGIDGDIIKIGTADGKIKEVRRADISFEPQVGDKVDLFENESSIVVTKAEEQEKNVKVEQPSGVNININNSNENQTAGTTYTGDGKKVVNKWVYVILALFLGGIGAHKFYAGKTGAGICYLLFCWTFIPGFIAFIELIVALCAKADSNGNILV